MPAETDPFLLLLRKVQRYALELWRTIIILAFPILAAGAVRWVVTHPELLEDPAVFWPVLSSLVAGLIGMLKLKRGPK